MSNPKLTDDCWWHEFGVNPDTGRWDIADNQGDIASGVDPGLAERIIKAHNAVIERIADRYIEWITPTTELEMLTAYWEGLGPNARAALLRQAQLLSDGSVAGDFDDARDMLQETLREFEDAANYASTKELTYSTQALTHLALAGVCMAKHLDGLRDKRPTDRITVVEAPGDMCGGTRALPTSGLAVHPCPGCRACS